ncbi:MAG: replicative DNA helicase [Anaerosomatales bacterium]|nr:replicative DNA helicase [Anaerosomatales bacterium]
MARAAKERDDPTPVNRGGREAPYNEEAEQSLLGAMLLSSEAVEVGLSTVEPSDFALPRHGVIFSAIQDLYNRGEAVDQITVADRLASTGRLEDVGGKPYLIELVGRVPMYSNAAHYAEIVKRTATLRELIRAGTDIATLGYERGDDLDEAIEAAEKRLFDVTKKRVSSNFKPMRDLLKTSFEQIEVLAERKEHVTGVPTGFPELDKILAGLHKGDLIILAARPSVGKTALALNIAVEAARKGYPVAIFSLEMSSEQLVQRLLCAEARVDSHRLRTGYLNDSDWPALVDAAGRLGDMPLWVDDTASTSIVEVRAKARRLFRDKQDGLIVVDYLQLMQPQNRRSENRQQDVADISRGLKILAKELDIPVLALSQLSRAVEQRRGRPVLSDLRESGAIEQDADVVMFIHRDTMPRGSDEDDARSRDDVPPKGEAEIIVAKHRNGPTGLCRVSYLDRYTKFVPLAKHEP